MKILCPIHRKVRDGWASTHRKNDLPISEKVHENHQNQRPERTANI